MVLAPKTFLLLRHGSLAGPLQSAVERWWPHVELATASNLASARQVLASTTPDLILAQPLFPDGQAIDLLSSAPDGATIPLLLLIAPGEDVPALDQMEAGACDYLLLSDGWPDRLHQRAKRTLAMWVAWSGRQRMLRILEAQVRLSEFARTASLDDLLRRTLDEAENLTRSQIGFFHFLEADQETLSLQMWSSRTLSTMCTAEGKGQHYAVSQAGAWVDCIRQRGPVIHNDFASLPHRKGMPPGHAVVTRELVTPIIRGGLITCLLGVGNKPTPYDTHDVEVLGTLASLAWDLVESRRSREQLEESEQRFSRIMDLVPSVAVQGYRPDGTVVYWNPASEHLYGYRAEEAIGKNLLDLIIPEAMRAEVGDAIARMVARCSPLPAGELTLHDKGGQPVHVLSSHAVVQPPHGLPMLYCMDVDLTQLRQEEDALLRSRAELNAIYDLAPVMMCVLDRQRRVLYANRALGEYVERASAKLIGERICKVLCCSETRAAHPPAAREHSCGCCALRQLIEATFRTGEAQLNVEHHTCLHRDAGPREAVLVASTALIQTQEEAHLLLCLEDATERIRATEALQASEDQFRAIANYTIDWETWFGPDRRLIWVNPAVEAFTGYTAQECLAMADYPLPMVHPDDRATLAHYLEQAHAGGRGRDVEFRVLHRDGSCRWGAVSWQPIFDAQQRPLGHRASVRDVTERRRAEDERLQLERRLLHAQKLESLGVLAGGVAHDFNNLLQAIQGNLELALMGKALDAETQQGLQEALRAGRRAADLTRQLLAYAGKGRFVLRKIDLVPWLEENAAILRTVIARHIDLHTIKPARLPWIVADPGQLQQIVMNLLTNAAEAIGERAGAITIAVGNSMVTAGEIATCRLGENMAPGGYVWLEVTDDGCGMDEATQRDLFNPFFTTKFLGRGLGMSAVQGIVTGHKGLLMLKSTPGAGTRIRVLFPEALPESDVPAMTSQRPRSVAASLEPTVGSAPPDAAPEPASARPVVLLVDDEEIVLNLGAAMLRQLGYAPQLASDGETALEILRSLPGRVACVLLDVSMPRFDGGRGVRALRRLVPALRIIHCSAYSREDAVQRMQGEPVEFFLQKPYRMQTLSQVLAEALGRPANTPPQAS